MTLKVPSESCLPALKNFFLPLIFVAASIAFLSNCGFFHPQPEVIYLLPPKEEVKKEAGGIKGFKQEGAIIHKNCLFRCPVGAPAGNIVADHDAIILSSNTKTKFADWVAYKVTPADIDGPERKRNWAKDPKIDVQFTFMPQDYKGMSKEPYFFDRGHQAPLASFKGHLKWHTLNYLSNITPQKKDLNRGPWKALESAERKLVRQYGTAYVLTGPWYGKQNIVNGPLVERINYIVPSGYWKIIAVKEGGAFKTASFIFSQSASMRDDYCKHLASVSAVAQKTSLKFFDGKLPLRESALKTEIGCAFSVKPMNRNSPKARRKSPPGKLKAKGGIQGKKARPYKDKGGVRGVMERHHNERVRAFG